MVSGAIIIIIIIIIIIMLHKSRILKRKSECAESPSDIGSWIDGRIGGEVR